MTTQDLICRRRLASPDREGQRLSLHEMWEWLRDLESRGWIVERSPDDWYPTPECALYLRGLAEAFEIKAAA